MFATFSAGMAPVWQARRLRPIAGLHGDHIKGGREGRWNLRSVLVTAQLTTATVLLASSGLFIRSLWTAAQTHPGFDMEHVATIELDTRGADIAKDQTADFEQQVIRRINAIPGVLSASAVSIVPLSMNTRTTSLEVESDQNTRALSVRNNTVAPDYFRTMQIPVVQGREFMRSDLAGDGLIAVVNQTFARQVLGGSTQSGARAVGDDRRCRRR